MRENTKKSPKSKKKTPPRPRGRPRHGDYLPFEEAAKVVRNECLASSLQYYEWWDRNRPYNLPRRPTSTYNKEWKGWGYYIGVYNGFGTNNPERDPLVSKKQYRPLVDVQKFAAMHGVKTQEDWYDLVRENKLPIDIPSRPDIVYSGTPKKYETYRERSWISWKYFLAPLKKLDTIEAKIESVSPILYVATSPSGVNGVYLINIIGGGAYELKQHLQVMGVRLVAAFYTDIEAKHKPIIGKLNNYIYGQKDEYLIENVWEVIAELELLLEQVRFN